MAKSLMVQGAGSNVGKSLFVAGLARAFTLRGLSVCPFKPQNMSNNAAVTRDGGEIGRAQALQARACGIAPLVDMNPVLLKPETETGAQVIVQGERLTTVKARDYAALKPTLLPRVLQSYRRISKDVDLVLVEGAGSPAEINLRQGDIANMGFAEAANTPVVLLGDIDRGGVIAQLVGTHQVLSAADRSRVKAFAINKFRGDARLFDSGLDEIALRTGWSAIGVMPWFDDAWRLPAEDVMDIASNHDGAFKIVVPRLSRIANFDDLDPLAAEPDVSVEIVPPGRALPGDADLVVIPGTKSTIADLAFFRDQGWDVDLAGHIRRGGQVLGICGGYQMLGAEIDDPDGIEGHAGRYPGLGFLDVTTRMRPHKHLTQVEGNCLATGAPFTGYEIHIGDTEGPDCKRPWLSVNGTSVGAASENGCIRGCYLHGIFKNDAYRKSFLRQLGTQGSTLAYADSIEQTLDALAAQMESSLDLDRLLALAQEIQA